MQIEVSDLREALELLEPAVPKKPNVASLTCALIGDGKAYATDIEVAVQIGLHEAEGKLCVPVRDTLQVLKGIPGSLMVDINQSRQMLSLSWEGGEAELETHHPEDYPPMPEVHGVTLELDERLVDAMGSVVGYCSTDEARPVLSGVTLILSDELEVAAGDGFRMAYTTVSISAPEEAHRQIIVPAHAVRLLGKLWKKSPGVPGINGLNIAELVASRRKLGLTLDKDKACFSFGGVNLAVKLIPGNPPTFKQLIPQEPPKVVEFFAPDLLRAVKQLDRVETSKEGATIRLTWEDRTLKVWAKGADREVSTAISATSNEPGQIALSTKYLRDYLKDRQGMISMGVSDEQSPMLFRSSSPVTVVIMPHAVSW